METKFRDMSLYSPNTEPTEPVKISPDAKRSIQALRETIESNPKLNFQTDDEFLLRFLRSVMYDQDEALKLIEIYYEQGMEYPEFTRTESGFKEAHSSSSNIEPTEPDELDESTELAPDTKRSIQALREKILSKPEMNFQTDDEFLLRFLRAEMYDQREAFNLIKRYYDQRLEYPEFFRNLSAANYSQVLASNYLGSLPHKDRLGRNINIFNTATHWDAQTTSLEDNTANCVLTLERVIQDQNAQTKGIVVIVDAAGLGFSHVKRCMPSAFRQMFYICVNNFPARYKQIHVVNDNWIFWILFNIMKPFLYKNLRTLFLFHGTNFESLHEHISPDVLPKEFGGNLGPYDNKDWNKILLENDDKWLENLKYGYVTNK